jgi:hypothetical protein
MADCLPFSGQGVAPLLHRGNRHDHVPQGG